MYFKVLSASVLLIMVVLLMGLFAGCGGADQSGDGSQGDGTPDQAKKQVSEAAKKRTSPVQTALGTIKAVNTEKRRLVLKPSAREQGEKPTPFRITKNATITLDEKKVELADIREGQQAQISYVVFNEKRNRARTVTLFEGKGGEKPSENSEKTG